MAGKTAKKRVYVESSVISYLTARLAPDPVRRLRQQMTREWWKHRDEFLLYTSQAVLGEIRRGDPGAAQQRENTVRDMLRLDPVESAERLADRLIQTGAVPKKAGTDAAHIALAAVHGMDYLATWNHSHIVNATKMGEILQVIESMGHKPVAIVTPENLLEYNND